MNCKINLTNGKKSLLYKELEEILGSEELAVDEMLKIQGKMFKQRFGDYKQMYKDDYDGNLKMKESKYTNVDGEPSVHKKNNQYYINFPDGTKYSINKVSFGNELTDSQILDVTNTLLFDYMAKDGNVDVNDFTLFDPKNIIPSIESSMENYKAANEGNEKDIKAANIVLKYKEEFKKEIINAIESKGFRYKEKIYDAEGNLEGNDGDNLTEEEKISAVNIKESIEKNSKDNATANTKLFLSLIPKSAIVRENGKASIKKVLGSFIAKPSFVDFNEVWSTLEPLLADIIGTGDGSNVKDPFKLMMAEIKKLHSIKPWTAFLYKELSEIDGDLKEEKRAEFVQAFSKTRVNLYVSDYKNSLDVDAFGIPTGGKTIKYSFINATSTNSRFNKVRTEWGETFRRTFLNGKGQIKEIKDIELVKDDITKLRAKFLEDSKENNLGPINAVKKNAEELIKALNLLGIDVNLTHLYINIKMSGEENAFNTVNDIFSGALHLLDKELLVKDNSFIKDGDYSSPLATQSFIKNLAEAKAMTQYDTAENTVVGNEGKTYWTYSSPSYISNTVNEWKKNNGSLHNLSKKVYNGNSRWIAYLSGSERDHNGDLVNDTEESRIIVSKNRIEALELGMASSFKTDKEGFDNKTIEITDAFNDNMHKVLGDKFGDKSLFSTITPADKSRKIEIVGFESFDAAIDYTPKNGWYVHEDTVSLFVDYFEDEYNRMKIVSDEIENLPKSKLVKHYHTGAKNGLKSQLFPDFSHDSSSIPKELKDILYDGSSPITSGIKGLTDDQKELLAGYIKEDLIKRLKEAESSLTSIGVFKKNLQGELKTVAADNRLDRYYLGNTSPAHAMIGDYIVNGLISSVEYGKLFSGDPAYYKNAEDLIKRIPATYTDGQQLVLTNSDQINFNIAVIDGVEVASKYLNEILASLKLQKNKDTDVLIDKNTLIPNTKDVLFPERYYGLTISRAKIAMAYDKIFDKDGKAINGGVNTTDAQAWITPDRWEFILRKLGKWSEEHTVVSRLMRKGYPLTTAQMKIAAQPLKGVYFNIQDGVPVYLKYSQAVLIPALVKNTPMQKLYDKMTIDPVSGNKWSDMKDKDGNSMRSSQIHEVITIDGVKVGGMGITKINVDNTTDIMDDFELNPYPLSNRGWKLQQDLPNKQMHETLIGSQLQKNILAGLALDGDYTVDGKDIKGSDLLKKIHETVSGLSNFGKDEIIERLGIDENGVITNTDRLYEALIEEFKAKDGSRNIVSALEKGMDLDAIPQVRNKVQSIFMSMMNKAMVKITTNGGSFIQVSPFGIETINQGIDLSVNKNKYINWSRTQNNTYDFSKVEFINVYRAEGRTVDSSKLPKSVSANAGSWFTNDLKEAERYAKMGNRKLYKVAIPKTLYNNLYESRDKHSEKSKGEIQLPKGISSLKEEISKNNSGIRIVSKNYDGKGLKPPRIKGGKVLPGQVLIPHSAIVSILENYNRGVPKKERIRMNNLSDKELLRLIDPSALELLSYRIPNQGMSSNDMLEIVGILPEGMGDSIVAYDGVPAKTGSDFDIDKMFVMMNNLEFIDGKIQKIKKNRSITHQDAIDNIEAKRKDELESIAETVEENYDGEAETEEEYYDDLEIELKKQINIINRRYDKMIDQENSREKKLEKNLLENELISLYKSVLLNPGTYDAMMTSIDASFFKDDILDLFPPKKHGNLSIFNPVEQIKIKFEYMSGKFGVAQTANQLVDHNLSQSTRSVFRHKLGIGNFIGDNSTEFDQEYDSNGEYRIADVLSAFLNAYVDIAKDPYISRGNHNTVTANTVFMLVRAGVPLKWVNRFVGQPILKELVEITKNSKSSTAMPLKNRANKVVNPYEFLRDKYGFSKNKVSVKDVDSRFSIDKLEKNIKSEGIESMSQEELKEQMEILSLFEHYKDLSKDFSLGVRASKADTKGGGGSFSTLFITQNTYHQVINDNYLMGFEKKFQDTMLGNYHSNSVTWVESLLDKSQIFLTGKNSVKRLYNDISASLGKGLLQDEDLARELDKSLYAYMMSDFSLFSKNNDNIDDLFKDLSDRLLDMKENKSNFLIDELEIKFENGFSFIGIDSKNKPTTYKDRIYREWVNLLRSKDPKEVKLGKDLAKYAFSSSGFANNLSQFFSNMPHEILGDNNIDLYIKKLFSDIDQGIEMDSDFKDQMFRHNANNDVLVPVVSLSNNAIKGSSKKEGFDHYGGGLIYNPNTASNDISYEDDFGNIKYPLFVKNESGDKSLLYKMIGTIEKEVLNKRDQLSGNKNGKMEIVEMPVYIRTYKLGYSGKKGKIFEYKYRSQSKSSSIASNNEQYNKTLEYRKDFYNNMKSDSSFLTLDKIEENNKSKAINETMDDTSSRTIIEDNLDTILKDLRINKKC